ncbi:MAG: hypothetical protein ACYCXT_12155 [Acidiferrobacteraceae bacterium]
MKPFVEDLAGRLAHRIQFSTDDHTPYRACRAALEQAFCFNWRAATGMA